MKPSTVLGAAVLLSVTSAALTSLLLASGPRTEAREPALEAPTRLDELVRRQNALEASLDELRAALASPALPAGSSPRAPVMDDSAIERAVERILERRRRSSDEGKDEEDALAASTLLHQLFALDLDDAERARIWRELGEGGHIDAAVAEFERRAEAAPFDSLAQTELGWAYFQKMVTVGGGPEAGKWGAKGAGVLEHALELDDTNWDARFSLAQHLYYADMRGDAIRHLERLQQENRAAALSHRPRPGCRVASVAGS